MGPLFRPSDMALRSESQKTFQAQTLGTPKSCKRGWLKNTSCKEELKGKRSWKVNCTVALTNYIRLRGNLAATLYCFLISWSWWSPIHLVFSAIWKTDNFFLSRLIHNVRTSLIMDKMTIDGMIHRQRVIVCRFSWESGRNGEGDKSHALPNNSKLQFLFDNRACVSGFLTAVQMIRNVFSEQVFLYGTSAAWCAALLLRYDLTKGNWNLAPGHLR